MADGPRSPSEVPLLFRMTKNDQLAFVNTNPLQAMEAMRKA